MHVYIELQATLPSRAITFYTTLFPTWSFQEDPSLPIPYYRGSLPSSPSISINILQRAQDPPEPMQPTNAFVCSFPVNDEAAFEELEKKVLDMGGKIAMPRFQVPGRGVHGYFLDTEGNTFGVFTTTYTE
ncbi:hypothetical protein TWF481_004151 [Arthrobotrys musiformis]|uniref:VOC domain-containing protein n=1 Tax=Arthrobotrys musiformis TaxID=47236 RepID=A0AAV9WIM7_9PEZI